MLCFCLITSSVSHKFSSETEKTKKINICRKREKSEKNGKNSGKKRENSGTALSRFRPISFPLPLNLLSTPFSSLPEFFASRFTILVRPIYFCNQHSKGAIAGVAICGLNYLRYAPCWTKHTKPYVTSYLKRPSRESSTLITHPLLCV